jgi:SAM-dependent methyltransferase
MASYNQTQREYWEGKSHHQRRSPDHLVVAAFARPKLALAAKYGAFASGIRVLDVGCGNGFFTYHLPDDVHAVGLDFSRLMLQLNPASQVVQGSALKLPFNDRAFDTVFCSNLLHHLPEPQFAIAEMHRVAKRYVVLSEPSRNNPGMFMFGLVKPEERWSLRFTPRYLRTLAERSGLQVKFCRALGMIVPNKVTPPMLPLLRLMDGVHPLGAYILLVAEKVVSP